MTDEILKMWKNEKGKFRGPIFLGLSDEVEPNRFVWDSNGEDLKYTFWARRRGPQESETENYAIMRGKIMLLRLKKVHSPRLTPTLSGFEFLNDAT